MNVYLCLFLFFLFLWLPWWLPDEEEEAAFWGFKSWSVESTSSVSSWLGSFSWFWRSGEASLSVPLPASPETTQNSSTTFASGSTVDWERKTFSTLLCLRIISKSTHVFHSCDPVFHQVHILPANQTVCCCISYFLARQQMRNSPGMEKSPVRKGLTATDVTDDLLNRRSASLNFLFLLSVLLLEFLFNLQRQSLYGTWQLRKLCKIPPLSSLLYVWKQYRQCETNGSCTYFWLVRYRSHPLMMLPYIWVSSR